jgi:hypothetical protein
MNIIELIEKNPIARLSTTYNNKLLNKLKETFTEFEQQIFVGSFYCYLKYDKNKDFVIDLDDAWKWLGFKQKIDSKRLLEKQFKLDIDYKNLAPQVGGASSNEDNLALGTPKASSPDEKWGGSNIKKIFLTIKCFKSLCLKAQTKKADEIHEYYMKMEEVLHKVVEEETDELRLQLEQNQKQSDQQLKDAQKERNAAVEQAIISQFPVNTECVYFGTIDNTNDACEKLIKFGHSNNLATRVQDHHKTYKNFVLTEAFKVQNKVEIENLIKTHPKIKKQLRTLEVAQSSCMKTEIIAYDSLNFTIGKLTKCIKEIIQSKTYSIDNFNKLLKQNAELEDANRTLEEKVQELKREVVEMTNLKEKIAKQENIIASVNLETHSVYQNVLLPEDDLHKRFGEFIKTICIVRPDVEELSVNIEGRYRLWSKVKPSKETFHALKNYLDIRFKPKRIEHNHGYAGIKLRSVEYKRTNPESIIETFIFQTCKFSDCGKILNSVLLREYRNWKTSTGKELGDAAIEIKEIKEYLNTSQHALKATVWTDEGNNEGYYGLSLKTSECSKPKLVSSTGKKVYKREANTNALLASWETIVKAATHESISTAKMSRLVKHKNIINNDYYYANT